jgi:hypothetical protein
MNLFLFVLRTNPNALLHLRAGAARWLLTHTLVPGLPLASTSHGAAQSLDVRRQVAEGKKKLKDLKTDID